MAKTTPKKNSTQNSTASASTADASTSTSPLLTLAALTAMETGQRVDLYVQTENRQRMGFLLQGKILHTLGSEGLELLRAAGIKPSSLSNARMAEWVLGTFTHPEATAAIKALRFHDGTGAVEFSEAFYDTLTLRQCELLRYSFTTLGQPRHRPTALQATEVLAQPDWEDNLESILETGLTLAGVEERQRENERALQAERDRVAALERQIAEQAERDRLAAQERQNTPPPPPVPVTFNAAPPEPEAEVEEQEQETETQTETEQEPEAETVHEAPVAAAAPSTNIVPFTAAAETADEEDDDAADDDDTSDHLTPEEVAAAVHDATHDIDVHLESAEDHMTTCLDDLENGWEENLNLMPLEGLMHLERRLEFLLSSVRAAVAAKAEPQDTLPEAAPARKGRRGSKVAA